MKFLFRALLIACCLQAGMVYAQPELDMSFNSSGKTHIPGLIGLMQDMIVLPDNKILAVLGSSSVFRLNEDGSPDTTFGNNGIFSVSNGTTLGAAIQNDGKIVVVGYSFSLITVVRLNQDGSLDGSFGSGGTVSTDITPGDTNTARRVQVQPDGKILVAGYSQHVGGPTNGFKQFVARYMPDGTLDSSFGTGGIVKRVVGDSAVISAFALQPDGKMITGGYARFSSVNRLFLARYNADGSTDTTWDVDGVVTGPTSTNIDSIALQLDGRVLALDSKNLYRFNVDGSSDTSFDGDGVRPSLDAGPAMGVTVSASGRITVTGGTHTGTYFIYRYNVAKYLPDGSPDTSFSDNGYLDVEIAHNANQAMYVAMDSAGRTVVGGFTGSGSPTLPLSPQSFSAIRLLPSVPAGPVGLSGRVTRPDGAPVAGAVLILQGGSTIMTALTSPFGYYSFSNVPSGVGYTISPGSKKVMFTDKNIFIDGQIAGYNITSEPIIDSRPGPVKMGRDIK